MGEEAPGAAAVVLAVRVEVSGISPGNSKVTEGSSTPVRLFPVPPLVDPVVVVGPMQCRMSILTKAMTPMAAMSVH